MLYHWNMIEAHEEQNHIEMMFMSLLFTSNDNFIQSSKSFQEGLNWMECLKICKNPTKYGQFLFCKAVQVDMANSKQTSFSNTISSTFSLISVVFEDLSEAINIHKDCCDEKRNPQPAITLLNKTTTCDGYNFNAEFISDDDYNTLLKESLMLLDGYCTFGFQEFYKKLL
jgi:hypothetical protein